MKRQKVPCLRLYSNVLVASLLFASFFIGCGPITPNEEQTNNKLPHVIGPKPNEQAKTLALNAKVYCSSERPDDCSPSVGMLVTLSRTADENLSNVAQCSAFLVSEQVVMTNSHCIPSDLKADGSSCRDRMWIYFPELKEHRAVQVGCDQVIYSSHIPNETKVVADYAIIKLDKAIERPSLEIDRAGFKDASSYSIIKVDPQSTSEVIGRMNGTHCKAIHKSMIIPDSNQDQSPNMTMADCTIIQGNSGAPMLSSARKVRGIIQMVFKKDNVLSVLRERSIELLDGDVSPLGVATNLACLPLSPETGAPQIPQNCAISSSVKDLDNIIAVYLEAETQKVIEAELAYLVKMKILLPSFHWSAEQYPGYKTRIYSDSNETVYIPVPVCIKDMDSLLNGYSRWYYLGGYVGEAEKMVGWPKITVKTGVNRYLVPGAKVERNTLKLIDAGFTYNPSELSKKKATSFILDEIGWLNSRNVLFHRSVGLCN